MLRSRLSSVAAVAATSSAILVGTFALDRAPTASAQTVSAQTAAPAPACKALADATRLDHVLTRTAARLRRGDPITIVAIGSSSTAGAGASSPAASYPSRLEAELRTRFPHVPITVLNRGVNGERANDMLARFERDVIAEKPDLVLWQIGSNSLLRDDPIEPATLRIKEGVARLKEIGADVVLMNPQFAPKIITRHNIDGMVTLIDTAAKAANVSVFHRYRVMRHWKQVEGMDFSAFLSPDELHHNDWSYSCIAKLLAASIAEAATRPATTAHALPSGR
jgi:acyl-CoA thioesterase I